MSDDKGKKIPNEKHSKSDYEKSLTGMGNLRPVPQKPDTGNPKPGKDDTAGKEPIDK